MSNDAPWDLIRRLERENQQLTTEVAAGKADTRAVIDAVLQALDIPYAATLGHDETRHQIMQMRTIHLVVCLRNLAEYADAKYPPDLDHSLAYLRERLAEHPPAGYVTHEQAQERLKQGATWLEAVALRDEAGS